MIKEVCSSIPSMKIIPMVFPAELAHGWQDLLLELQADYLGSLLSQD
jgi:hypothetical protein